MNEQIIRRFNNFAILNSIEIDLESIEFFAVPLSNTALFRFVKGQNRYIRKSIAENPGNIPVVGASLENQCIYDHVKPLHENDAIREPSVSFNKDNAKGSRAFFRNYPYVMDRHHIAIIPDSEKINAEYLHLFLDNFLRNQGYSWGENVATVEAVEAAEIPVPISAQIDSITIQKILVEFINYERGRYGWKLDKLAELYQSFDKLEKAVVPRTLAKSRSAMEKFQAFLDRENIDLDLNELEFKSLEFDQVFDSINPSIKIGKKDVKNTGINPVVSQSADMIDGYYDSSNGLIGGKEDPVVVFGDHTTNLKYIDFDFIPGADGTKILRAREGHHTRYLYFVSINRLSIRGYQRHYSLFRDLDYKIPTSKSYKTIELELLLTIFFERYSKEIEGKKNIIRRLEELLPQYQDTFVQVLFSSLKKQAYGQ